MPRWRPPAKRSSPYITPEGEAALKSELKELWLRRRQEVVPALRAAAAEGDRSENAEYIYRKKELAGIDRRIRYLQKRLPELTVVREAPSNPEQVFFVGDSPEDYTAAKDAGAAFVSIRSRWQDMDVNITVCEDLIELKEFILGQGIHYPAL